ncbi:MAG: YeeE/YedE family protein [Acidobacteria bacterium]|nr:YeeE/YedE family protein [Acidobacteriota bacterium]
MGPLVPDIISNQMNLIVALLLGIAFGFVLEQAGFSSSRKLTGLFYGTDFTVLRVFFSAAVTAMSGILILSQFGLLDTDLIFVNPTFLHSAIAGGLIMGVGFVVGGYCPGTSFCAAAVGKIDGMVFVLGGLLGALGFGEAYPYVQGFYRAGSLGDLMVYSPLGISAGQFALLLITAAIAAFVVTSKLESKINPASPVKNFPVRYHRVAAALLLIVGLALAAAPDRKTRLLAEAADPAYSNRHPMHKITADEMAFHLLDRDPQYQPVDVRSAAEFAPLSLPGAVNLPFDTLAGKAARETLRSTGVTTVFFATDEAGSVRAAELASLLGFGNVAVLEGGLDGFQKTILNASLPSGSLSPQQADTYRFRLRAGPEIATLIRERTAPKPVTTVKRIQGGCGT